MNIFEAMELSPPFSPNKGHADRLNKEPKKALQAGACYPKFARRKTGAYYQFGYANMIAAISIRTQIAFLETNAASESLYYFHCISDPSTCSTVPGQWRTMLAYQSADLRTQEPSAIFLSHIHMHTTQSQRHAC